MLDTHITHGREQRVQDYSLPLVLMAVSILAASVSGSKFVADHNYAAVCRFNLSVTETAKCFALRQDHRRINRYPGHEARGRGLGDGAVELLQVDTVLEWSNVSVHSWQASLLLRHSTP
ncbi:hypothetical protein EYF80_044198 [Liparis tanakae]|uniref:Uncharacterized protein n=1 Tax=Liparis tanakae TaxID=230148 RepID=A0A4Z2FZ39_9TELE|nr:hypothetical protein EYF80_044198 [Liparis tanakae]